MIDAIASFIESKSRTKTTRPETRVAPKALPRLTFCEYHSVILYCQEVRRVKDRDCATVRARIVQLDGERLIEEPARPIAVLVDYYEDQLNRVRLTLNRHPHLPAGKSGRHVTCAALNFP